jgi:hypothetical protein
VTLFKGKPILGMKQNLQVIHLVVINLKVYIHNLLMLVCEHKVKEAKKEDESK